MSLDRMLGVFGVLGIVIGVGVAIAMDPKVKSEMVFAVGCFIFSGVALCLTVGIWAFGTDFSPIKRLLISGVLFVIICTSMVEASRWANGRYLRTVVAEKAPEPIPAPVVPPKSPPSEPPNVAPKKTPHKSKPEIQHEDTSSRILTVTQEQELIETLKATPGANVRLIAVGNVPEVGLYAAQIQRAFEGAHWNVYPLNAGSGVMMEGNLASSPINLSIYTYKGGHASEIAVQAFKNANISFSLKEGELPYSGPVSFTATWPEPAIGIQIGLQQ